MQASPVLRNRAGSKSARLIGVWHCGVRQKDAQSTYGYPKPSQIVRRQIHVLGWRDGEPWDIGHDVFQTESEKPRNIARYHPL